MQLVREGLCPECLNQYNPRNRRLLKKGIKRECSQGHLIIYGNPLYLAYYRIEKKKEEKKVTGCLKCGGQAVTYDKKHDEIFCDDCGLVLSGPPQWIPPARWVNYPMGNRYDYADIDATYTPYETDRCDYGDYISE